MRKIYIKKNPRIKSTIYIRKFKNRTTQVVFFHLPRFYMISSLLSFPSYINPKHRKTTTRRKKNPVMLYICSVLLIVIYICDEAIQILRQLTSRVSIRRLQRNNFSRVVDFSRGINFLEAVAVGNFFFLTIL